MNELRGRHHGFCKEKGPSGVGRPKSREETPKEGCAIASKLADAAMQNMNALHKNSNAKNAELPLLAWVALIVGEAGAGGSPQKEAVRMGRPKSREETPVVGYGGEEVHLRNRNISYERVRESRQ